MILLRFKKTKHGKKLCKNCVQLVSTAIKQINILNTARIQGKHDLPVQVSHRPVSTWTSLCTRRQRWARGWTGGCPPTKHGSAGNPSMVFEMTKQPFFTMPEISKFWHNPTRVEYCLPLTKKVICPQFSRKNRKDQRSTSDESKINEPPCPARWERRRRWRGRRRRAGNLFYYFIFPNPNYPLTSLTEFIDLPPPPSPIRTPFNWIPLAPFCGFEWS